MCVKFDDIRGWLDKAGVPEWTHKRIAQAGIAIGVVWFLISVWRFISPNEASPPVHTAVLESTKESEPQVVVKSNKGGVFSSPCNGILGNYNFDDGTHQLQAWDLLEKTLAEMQRDKKNGIDIRLVEEARSDWNLGHSREALLKFSTALRCDAASK